MTLPLIDYAHTDDAGAAIDAGFAQYGFLQVANIGIDPALLVEAFAAAATFFHTPDQHKHAFAYRSAQENFGFQGLLEENLDPDAPPDIKQTFTMRNVINNPPAPERWPSDHFRQVMQALYASALAAAHTMQRAMAVQLGEHPEAFAKVHSGQNVTLRLLHYPPVPKGLDIADQMGAGAHTDYGFMTLLFQQGVSGLQVLGNDGEWLDVPPQEGAVVVNSGDMLERWTNGRYRSTLHRVKPQTSGRERFSIAMFLDPDSDTLVEVLPSCITAQSPARFGPITAGAHLQAKLEASHKGRFTT